MVEEKFLIDSNSFMTPYRQYYAFDLVPTYWKELAKRLDTGRMILLDMVKDEIDKGQDELSAWIDKQTGFVICNHIEPAIISKYQEVLQYVQNCGLYKPQALQNWAPVYIADPWLIAAATVNDYTIITVEKPSSGLSPKKMCIRDRTWADKNITKNFRSTLELIKLMDGAITSEETKNS